MGLVSPPLKVVLKYFLEVNFFISQRLSTGGLNGSPAIPKVSNPSDDGILKCQDDEVIIQSPGCVGMN
jgi:hypothetical protein